MRCLSTAEDTLKLHLARQSVPCTVMSNCQLVNQNLCPIGYWGYVEFGTSASTAQPPGASLVVDGYIIQLSVPFEPAPAYASSAQAAVALSQTITQYPQYIYVRDAQTGAAQAQYPGYYPAYGYEPNYGELHLAGHELKRAVDTALYYTVLSCPVLSCPVLSCPVLSCPVLSCPVLSCPVLSNCSALLYCAECFRQACDTCACILLTHLHVLHNTLDVLALSGKR